MVHEGDFRGHFTTDRARTVKIRHTQFCPHFGRATKKHANTKGVDGRGCDSAASPHGATTVQRTEQARRELWQPSGE